MSDAITTQAPTKKPFQWPWQKQAAQAETIGAKAPRWTLFKPKAAVGAADAATFEAWGAEAETLGALKGGIEEIVQNSQKELQDAYRKWKPETLAGTDRTVNMAHFNNEIERILDPKQRTLSQNLVKLVQKFHTAADHAEELREQLTRPLLAVRDARGATIASTMKEVEEGMKSAILPVGRNSQEHAASLKGTTAKLVEHLNTLIAAPRAVEAVASSPVVNFATHHPDLFDGHTPLPEEKAVAPFEPHLEPVPHQPHLFDESPVPVQAAAEAPAVAEEAATGSKRDISNVIGRKRKPVAAVEEATMAIAAPIPVAGKEKNIFERIASNWMKPGTRPRKPGREVKMLLGESVETGNPKNIVIGSAVAAAAALGGWALMKQDEQASRAPWEQGR